MKTTKVTTKEEKEEVPVQEGIEITNLIIKMITKEIIKHMKVIFQIIHQNRFIKMTSVSQTSPKIKIETVNIKKYIKVSTLAKKGATEKQKN